MLCIRHHPPPGFDSWIQSSDYALADFTLVNHQPFDMHLIMCSMSNLTDDFETVANTEIKADLDSGLIDTTLCSSASGSVFHPPSWHHGCQLVNVPAQTTYTNPLGVVYQIPGRRQVVNSELIWFMDSDGPVVFSQKHLHTSYIDFLEYSSLEEDCVAPDFGGLTEGNHNVFLSPSGTGGNQGIGVVTSNVWAAGDAFAKLTTIQWPPGNWWVMQSGAPTAPVYLHGRLEGLPEGAKVHFRVPDGEVALFKSFTVEAGESPCKGAPLDVALEYRIPNRSPLFSTLEVDVGAAADKCPEFLEHPRWANFDATVFAAEDYLHYKRDDAMYGISVVLFNDIEPPRLDGADLTFANDGSITGSFIGLDGMTTPSQAWVLIEQRGRHVAELLATVPDGGHIDEVQTRFEFAHSGLDARESAEVTLFINDEANNVVEAGPFVLTPGSETKFDQPAQADPTPGPMGEANADSGTCGCRQIRAGDRQRRVLWLLALAFVGLLGVRRARRVSR